MGSQVGQQFEEVPTRRTQSSRPSITDYPVFQTDIPGWTPPGSPGSVDVAMTFLPVAQRELLAAARRPGTYRARLAAAAVAALVGSFFLVAFRLTGPGMNAGLAAYAFLTLGCLLLALLAGVFLTADALSSERRDGTLGLLFLTETGPGDLILGKLLALGLNALGAILAVAPILGMAWLLGGLTGGQLVRTVATILNALFVSLAAGLAVSAGEREQSRALARTVIMLVLLTTAGSVAQGLNPKDDTLRSRLLLVLTGLSPIGGEAGSDDVLFQRRPSVFWVPFLVTHSVGWTCLLTARQRLRRRWHGEEPVGTPTEVRRRPRMDPLLLDRNPIQVLIGRSTGAKRMAWGVAFGSLILGLALLLWNNSRGRAGQGAEAFLLFSLPSLLLKGVFAWSATSFLAETRRVQALELLLTTPIQDQDLLRGQQATLASTFAGPFVMLYLGEYLAGDQQLGGWWLLGAVSALGTLLQCLAMARLGAWFALTERLPTVAVGKTFVLGALLPSALNWVCLSGLMLAPVLGTWAGNRLARPFRALLTSREVGTR